MRAKDDGDNGAAATVRLKVVVATPNAEIPCCCTIIRTTIITTQQVAEMEVPMVSTSLCVLR